MRKAVVFASLLAAPAHTAWEGRTEAGQVSQDPRFHRLQSFFAQHNCPLSRFAADFVREADANALDWRLLPSITFVESGGGKHYRNNNIFGWNSANTRFGSVSGGIHMVARQLAHSALYRHKDLDAILRTYNPRPEYLDRVKSVMRVIGQPDPPRYGSPN